MLKKTFAFGLLAAALTIAPNAAFAGQYQENIQITEQNGAAINGSTNAQTSTSVNVQEQIQRAANRAGAYRGGYRKPYYGGSKTCVAPQSQASRQVTNQSGAATDDSVNAQDSNTRNNQRQTLANNCR